MAMIGTYDNGESFYLFDAGMGDPICACTFDSPNAALEWANQHGIEVYQQGEED